MTEIFSLVGKVLIDGVDKAKADLNQVTGEAEQSSGRFSNFLGKMGNAAVQVGKAVVTGIGVGATAIGTLTKLSIDAYASYEQLVGGIETLFGTGGMSLNEYAKSVGKSVEQAKAEFEKLQSAQNKAMENAHNAWKNQGMSANEYMETITSFSASLIQSLGGDTAKAVEVADVALTDMADNANKMGTDMELIQNAYQGFSKANFMMLDNLKLGYGGTKTEMERLLKDAEKIKKANGEMADYSIDSFADMVEAIHVIQEEMGIAGTTAKEATETIEGSLNAMKAAWQNVLVGLSDDTQDFDVLLDNLVQSVGTYANNIVPVIKKIFDAIPKLIHELLPQLVQIIDDLLPPLIESTVTLISGLVAELPMLLGTLVKAIIDNIPILLDGIAQLLNNIKDSIVSSIGTMFTSETYGGIFSPMNDAYETYGAPFIEKLKGVWDAVKLAWESILPSLQELVTNFFGVISDVWNSVGKPIFDFWYQIIMDILDAFTNSLPAMTDLFNDYVTGISEAWETYGAPLFEKMGEVVRVLSDAWDLIFPTLQEVFTTVVTTISTVWESLGKPVFDFLYNIIQSIVDFFVTNFPFIAQVFNDVVTMINDIWLNILLPIFDAIMTYLSDVWLPIINGIWEQFLSVFQLVVDTISSLWTNILQPLFQGIIDFIGGVFTLNWQKAWDGIKKIFETIFTGIYKFFSDTLNNIFKFFSDTLNNIYNTVSTIFNNVWQTVTNIWNNIFKSITEPFQKAVDWIEEGVEKVKNFLNFEFKWPHIPLPHFSINPDGWSIGDLLKGSIPSLGIEWYAKGGILTNPTAFGVNPQSGKLMVGGEAGDEAIAPIDTLLGYVRQAVNESNSGLSEIMDRIYDLLAELLPNMNLQVVLDTGVVAGELTPYIDENMGDIKRRKER